MQATFPRTAPEEDEDEDPSSDDSFFLAPTTSNAASASTSEPILPPGPFASFRPPRPASATFAPSTSFLSTSSSSSASSSPVSLTAPLRPSKPPKKIQGTKTTFLLGGKLGEGAYAVVKEGIDESTLRIVAIKVLDLHRLRRVRGGVEAVEREVAVQKRLKRHRNLIELIDVVRRRDREKMYIVLEIANGRTVDELADLAPCRRLPESQVANFAFQTLTALQYMHGKGVVHRDIKPSNMMLTASGDLKLSDFGVAEFLNEYEPDNHVTRTSGSPAFQAPEIATGAARYSGTKVDVWALGVTLYYLLTGTIPFHADNLLVLFDLISKGVYDEPDCLSEEPRKLIRSMLNVDCDMRPSVDVLLKDPWVVRGAADLSDRQRADMGWIAVPRKHFKILDLVKRMYDKDGEVEQMEDGGSAGKAGHARDGGSPPRVQQWLSSPRSRASSAGQGEMDGASNCVVQ